MEKFSDLLGLPVLVIETSSQIGEVEEVVADIDQARVIGVVLDNARYIAFQDLHAIGRDALTIQTAEVIKSAPAILPERHFKSVELLHKQIYTETGLLLGTLVDILFEESIGEIKGYQVSDGVVTDLLYGRFVLPLPQVQVVGQNKMIVPDSMAKLLQTWNSQSNL